MKRYKNTASGPAFVLGNGPSLRLTPWDKLAKFPTFAVNRIAKVFHQTAWRPTYFVWATTTRDQWIRLGAQAAQVAFVWDVHQNQVPNGKPIYFHASETQHIEDEDAAPSFFSLDCNRRVSKFGTSIFPAVQIAVYMGFDPIYLLGCDGGREHFYADMISHQDNTETFITTHALMGAAAIRYGFELYDCTPSGLGVLPFARLDDVLN